MRLPRLARREFLRLAAGAGALPALPHVARRKLIRRGQCASLSDLPPLAEPTSWRA
jgi:hypothetical protein